MKLPGRAAAPSFTNSCTTSIPDSEKSPIDNWEDVTPETPAKSPVESLDNNVDGLSVSGLLEKFIQDCMSESLEAYKFDPSTKSLFQLPLGHVRLTHELNRMVNSGKGSVFDRIVSLDVDRQNELNLVIGSVQKRDSRPRTCLDFDLHNKQLGTVFFAVGAEPIHEKAVHLKDCTGQEYNIPSKQCKLNVSASGTQIYSLII